MAVCRAPAPCGLGVPVPRRVLNPVRCASSSALVRLLRCAREARGLAVVAADPDASHGTRVPPPPAVGPRRPWRSWRAAVPERARTAGTDVPGDHPGADRALAHLHGPEGALAARATPLRGSLTSV